MNTFTFYFSRYALRNPEAKSTEVKKKYQILVEFLDNTIFPLPPKLTRKAKLTDAVEETTKLPPERVSSVAGCSRDEHQELDSRLTVHVTSPDSTLHESGNFAVLTENLHHPNTNEITSEQLPSPCDPDRSAGNIPTPLTEALDAQQNLRERESVEAEDELAEVELETHLSTPDD